MAPQFPQEILIEILSRLPADSIGQCRCVSKPWNNLLSTPEFTTKTHQKKLIFISPTRDLHTVSIQVDGFSRNLKSLPDTWEAILGSSNGLVLLRNTLDEKFLVNPVTLQKARVPDSPLALDKVGSLSLHGFGYDSSSDDYKIVTLSSFDSSRPDRPGTFVDVYSMKSGVWKRLDNSPYDLSDIKPNPGGFVNGSIHWLASKNEKLLILGFHLAREVFDEIPTPRIVAEGLVFDKLVAFEECLCMIGSIMTFFVDVWIMKEYGVVDSWTKFRISATGFEKIKPLCYIGDREVVIVSEDVGVIVYDPISEDMNCLIVDEVPAEFLDGRTFLESLVSPV